ncbi:hypothetical protein GOBAR_AA23422 [Gossypium barbadense]|uniref:Uncharacterized protein n=1 Tax=Gossypium barbadense TaxID=3634 RepID=A0A2P5X1M9_GOSBA|nr:hypothetical protein GOBAR_AA23422 [Gossypium barbadense]
MKQSPFKLAILATHQELKEMSLKEAHESFSSNSRGPVHEDRRLQIEEVDEWRTHKPRTPDKLNLRQNELNTFPNQLKIGDRVLLDAADPHIVATTPNEEIPLTIRSIFSFSTVEAWEKQTTPDTTVRHGHVHPHAQGTQACTKFPPRAPRRAFPNTLGPTLNYGPYIDWAGVERVQMADGIRALLTTDLWELFFGIIEPTYLELTMELCLTFHLQIVMTNYDDPGMVQFRLGREAREHCRHQHSRRLLLMVYVARARHQPSLFHCPRNSTPDGAALEGGHLHWPLCDAIGSTLRAPQHHGPRIIFYPHWLDISIRHQGTYPPQYRLAQSIDKEAYKGIPDDVPSQHEDPPSQPLPLSHPVHAAASYADISKCLN